MILVLCLLLPACAILSRNPTPTPPTATPTVSPWRLGTPEPLFAPLTGECLAAGTFPPHLDGVRYGINVFLFATDTNRVLALTDIAGFEWVRQQIHWHDLEGEKEQYVWRPLDRIVSAARAYDKKVMLSVVRSPPWATHDGNTGLPDDPAAFAEFLHKVATRYSGRVSAYEIWNEPNLSHECGGTPCSPAAYLATLKAAYPAIKAADPCALVLAAPMAATNNPNPTVATDDIPFYEALYTLDDGAFLHAADAVAVHPGAGPHPPDAHWPPDAPEQSHYYFRHIERVRDLMLRYGDTRQVWITEVGWTVTTAEGAPQPVTERQQADYMIDMLWLVRQRYPWVAGVLVWNLNFSIIAPPTDEKTTFSILAPDWSIRPAFLSLQHNIPALRDIEKPPFLSQGASHTFAWNFPGRGAMHTAPLLAPDGTLYTVSAPGTTYAISHTGALQWQHDASGIVRHTPTRSPDSGRLFVADSASLLTALEPDGTVAWATQQRSPVHGRPIYHRDTVYTVNMVGDVQAFDATTGAVQWSRELAQDTTSLALASDGTLLVGTAEGHVLKLNPEDGTTRWQSENLGGLWVAPVPNTSGGAYIVTVDGWVTALDAEGRIRWQTSLGAAVIAPPLVGEQGTLAVAARDGTLTTLATDDGRVLWRFATGSSDLKAPPAQGADGTYYLGTDDERLLVLDREGTLQWQAYLRGAVVAPPVIGADGTLYVATAGGRLYAFQAAPVGP